MPPPSLLLLHSRARLPPRPFRMSSPALSRVVCSAAAEGYISAAPILLPDGPWKQVEGGVTAAKGFRAVGIYGGLRARLGAGCLRRRRHCCGKKQSLLMENLCQIIHRDAVAIRVMPAREAQKDSKHCSNPPQQRLPPLLPKRVLLVLPSDGARFSQIGKELSRYKDIKLRLQSSQKKSRLHSHNSLLQCFHSKRWADDAKGDAGYQDAVDSADAVAKLLNVSTNDILIQSTGVIGQRIKKDALLISLPRLVGSLSSSIEGANSAAVAITTTDLVSKSIAVQTEIGVPIRIGGMAKGSGMIHPNMETMLGVLTTDAQVSSDVWREMVRTSVSRSFNQITVDGDTSTNDCVIAMASGLSSLSGILTHGSTETQQFQACLDAVMQGLANSIAWDGEGATCLIEATVTGANNEAEAAKIARSVPSSSLVKGVAKEVERHGAVI